MEVHTVHIWADVAGIVIPLAVITIAYFIRRGSRGKKAQKNPVQGLF